jgi:hypothetical protein
MENRRLGIPICLNQRVVFALLAITEGGFSQLRSIKSYEKEDTFRKNCQADKRQRAL